MSKSSEGQGHDVSNNVCEHEENWVTNERVIRGKQNINANCLRRRRQPTCPGFTNL